MVKLLSGDGPRSVGLGVIIVIIAMGLALAPFVFPGSRSQETAARIAIFIVLVASCDLLLGYGGIVSFAHTMFFGLGAYGVALATVHLGLGWGALVFGAGAGLVLAVALAFVIALFSLRVRAIFFAMITLAIASAVAVLVSQLSWLTGGEDGMNIQIPRELTPAYRPEFEIFETRITGRILNYYLVLGICTVLFLLLLRIVNSPFGRVLQAIRENPFRAEAIGYRVVIYRTAATCLSAGIAALAGSLFAIWLRYVGPDTTLSMEIMIDILLMVVIGGMGTIWGAVVGAAMAPLIRALDGFACTAPDLPGHGDSTGPADVPAAVAMLGTTLAKGGPCVLVGLSLGALIAWRWLADNAPGQVRGMVSLDMSPRPMPAPGWNFGMTGQIAEGLRARSAWFRGDWDSAVGPIAAGIFARDTAPMLKPVRDMIAAQDPDQMAIFWESLIEQDCRDAVAHLPVPLLASMAHKAMSTRLDVQTGWQPPHHVAGRWWCKTQATHRIWNSPQKPPKPYPALQKKCCHDSASRPQANHQTGSGYPRRPAARRRGRDRRQGVCRCIHHRYHPGRRNCAGHILYLL